MKQTDMYAQHGYLFRRAHQLATAAFNFVAKEHDVTAVQMASLISIKDNAGIGATRLSDIIRLDRTTIGHVIGRLKKGLIKRAEGCADKRTKTLHITKKGSRVAAMLGELPPEIAEVIPAPLTACECTELLKILQTLDKHASRSNQPATTATDFTKKD